MNKSADAHSVLSNTYVKGVISYRIDRDLFLSFKNDDFYVKDGKTFSKIQNWTYNLMSKSRKISLNVGNDIKRIQNVLNIWK